MCKVESANYDSMNQRLKILVLIAFAAYNCIFMNKASCVLSQDIQLIKLENIPRDYASASCLDGSAPAYYVRYGKGDGLNKWIVNFSGGSWPFDINQAESRSKTDFGSSLQYPSHMETNANVLSNYLSSDNLINPNMFNWNTIFVKYCDGSSFAGDTVLTTKSTVLYFKGKPIRDAVINDLLYNRGMSTASNVLISGSSAGGLSVLLGLDAMANTITSANASISVKGLVDSGYFLETEPVHLDPSQRADLSKNMNKPGEIDPIVNGLLDFSGAMRSLFTMANISAGANVECIMKTARTHRDASMCIFAGNLVKHIKTPLFMIQSMYDSWQLTHILGNTRNYSLVNTFGREIVHQITTHLLSKPQHGTFLEACFHHSRMSCSSNREDNCWHGSSAEMRTVLSTNTIPAPLTPAQAFDQWFHGSLEDHASNVNTKTKAKASLHFYIQQREYPCHNCCACKID